MDSGTIWLNVTTTDAFGRTTLDVYSYIVDAEVNSLPQIIVTGINTTVNGTLYVPITTQIVLTNLSDDVGGVGYQRTECKQNNGTYQTILGSSILISGSSGNEVSKLLQCRIIDLLGNTGGMTELLLVLDGQSPNITSSVSSGTILGLNSSIQYNCIDSVQVNTYRILYHHQNLTHSASGTAWLNGSQPVLSMMLLLTNGNLALDFQCIDFFGNIGNVSISGIYYTSEAPYVEIILIGNDIYQPSSGQKFVGPNTIVQMRYKHNNNGNGSINAIPPQCYTSIYQHMMNLVTVWRLKPVLYSDVRLTK